MTGSILRGIGSFYTVLCDEDGREYTLRAQKKLRHQKMTPMVGDHVRFTPGQGEEDGLAGRNSAAQEHDGAPQRRQC